MKTANFDFVQGTRFAGYYDRLCHAEVDYINGDYSELASNLRVVAESIVAGDLRDKKLPSNHSFFDNLQLAKNERIYDSLLLDRFHEIRINGNDAVHSVKGLTSRSTAKTLLKDIFDILRIELLLQTNDPLFKNSLMNAQFYEPNESVEFGAVEDQLEPKADQANMYQTAERKLIYVAEVDQQKQFDPVHSGYLKIGDASIEGFNNDLSENSQYLRDTAKKRVHSYMMTAGLPSKVDWAELAYSDKRKQWFRDYDVHRVLKHSGIQSKDFFNKQIGIDDNAGREWFKTDVTTAKDAIAAVKDGRESIQSSQPNQTEIQLRPEQVDAIHQTVTVFNRIDKELHHAEASGKVLPEKNRTMLWNAKMRFGKTLTALTLVKRQQYQHVIIITHRPVVNSGWYDDFQKSGLYQDGYRYGSKDKEATAGGGFSSFADLKKNSQKFIYFASLQDLTGSESVGGKVSDKNQDVFHATWDLVIIDEAHEGTQTQLAESVLQKLLSPQTKILQLSGTPFNLLTSNDYDPDHVYTWSYVMEQQAKEKFAQEHPDEVNPYGSLPKMSMYTFELGDEFSETAYQMDGMPTHSFNFSEFFRVGDDGRFIHEKDVKSFLTLITTPDEKTNYPFSTQQFRDRLRHTLWILPSRAAANALEDLLLQDPVFGMYHIVNVVRDDSSDNVEEASESDLQKVRNGITDKPWDAHSITLTVRKLTTGVTIPEWTGVMFLSNTSSAMQYLQAAFRVQSPYSDKVSGEKTNCYVFDFAPDRALTVLAASASISPQRGRATTDQQRDQLGELLNFLPVLGMRGNKMRPYNVNALMGKIKQVFAERAVRTGFDDDSIYSDAFMHLTADDVKNFQHLRGIIGTSQERKKELVIDVNAQNLTDEERERVETAQKKKPNDRSPEEEAALQKHKQALEDRRKCISIIRGISIRIPLMIYGMDMPISDDVTLDEFVNKVDSLSWQEFMPAGVTKELFRQYMKYYDRDVFMGAGRLIRRKVRDLDDVDIYDRAVGIADIFHSFRNPDKETVLTPWNVVNLHLSKTIGGWCHFDESFTQEFEGTKRILRRVKTSYTDEVFRPQTRIVDINSKTGLYPLYMATSLYEDQFAEQARDGNKKVPSLQWQQATWQQILRDNIFVVAKTPMAKHIAQRTLCGFHSDWNTHIVYIENLIEDTRTDAAAEARKIESEFNNVKFDVVIGNPPYQQPAHGESTRQEPVYHLFYQLAYNLADIVTFISPARFLFDAGQTPKKWNKEMLNNPHLKVVMYEVDGQKIFPGTDIKGGVVITLMDKNKDFGAIKMFTPHKELASILQKVNASDHHSLSQIVSSRATYRFTPEFFQDYPTARQKMGKGSVNMITPKVFTLFPKAFLTSIPENQQDRYLTLLGLDNGRRDKRYIERRYVLDNDFVSCWNILVPEANGSGAFGEVLSTPVIVPPQAGSTDTFISIGSFASRTEAENLLAYIKTKFARALLDFLKVTQHNPRSTWRLVPLQDFTNSSDINWNVSIPEIDDQLYRKYGLDQKEIDFIEQNVQEMK